VQCDDSVKLRRRRARRNEIIRFAESKPFPQLVPEQQEVNAHLKNEKSISRVKELNSGGSVLPIP
jgi:hypothetical protein